MAIVHKEQAGLVSVAEPEALGSSAVGHCHPAQKHVLGTGCSSPPAPPCQPKARWWEAAQGQIQLRTAPLGAQAAGISPVPAGTDPALGAPSKHRTAASFGRAGKNAVSSHPSWSPHLGEISVEPAAEGADADRDSLKALMLAASSKGRILLVTAVTNLIIFY